MEFRTQYNRTPSKGEAGGGPCHTERAGYIPNKIRINNMMLAGQRLVDYRKEKYDWPDGTEIDEDFYDPTRARGFDLAEATQISIETEERIQSAQRATKKAREEAEKAAEASKKEKEVKDEGN